MPESDQDASETKSAQTRWYLTNDIAALWLVVTSMLLIGANGLGLVDLSTVPLEIRMALWVPMTGIATAWLFGGGAVKAWHSLQGE